METTIAHREKSKKEKFHAERTQILVSITSAYAVNNSTEFNKYLKLGYKMGLLDYVFYPLLTLPG